MIKERGKNDRGRSCVGSRYERGSGPTQMKGCLKAEINHLPLVSQFKNNSCMAHLSDIAREVSRAAAENF